MRRFLLLAVLVSASPAFAQTTFGVRAGLNVASVYGFDDRFLGDLDKGPVLGFVGGVFAEVPVSPLVAFRPEVLYSQKGFKIDFEIQRTDQNGDIDGTDEFSQTLRADYLEVPLLARVAVPVSPLLRVGVMAGPSLAFKVRESTSVSINGEEVPQEDFPDDDPQDLFNDFDLGGVLGAEIGSGPFSVDLRYTYGFLDVFDTGEGERDDDTPTLRNGVFSVAASYRLGL